MTSTVNNETSDKGDVWIITQGHYTDVNLKGIIKRGEPGSIMDYRISELAKYLLNPGPIEIQKKLIGCQIHYHERSSHKLSRKIGVLLKKNKDRDNPEILISDRSTKVSSLKDRNLESHLNKIYEVIRPYDSTAKRLANLDPDKISDVIGICEDPDGSRSWLKLQGDIDAKIKYMNNFVQRDIGIILEKAHIADGLFEMRGLDFTSFDPKKSYRLMKFILEGRLKFCVLGSNNNIEYWFDNINLIHYMHLLEQTIKTNPELHDSFIKCIQGEAKPLKLFFNKQFEMSYSKGHLPKLYMEVLKSYNMGLDDRDAIMNSLNSLQLGISFNYLPQTSSDGEKLFTNLSIMHDFRALEPIKDDLPQVYSEINKRVSISEAGSFYLLDSLGGYKDE